MTPTTIDLDVINITVSHDGRVVTLTYSRAPEPDESMDARRWDKIRREYRDLAHKQIASHGRAVEIYGSAPECQDWMIEEVLVELSDAPVEVIL
jgi:hypothetical protein